MNRFSCIEIIDFGRDFFDDVNEIDSDSNLVLVM